MLFPAMLSLLVFWLTIWLQDMKATKLVSTNFNILVVSVGGIHTSRALLLKSFYTNGVYSHYGKKPIFWLGISAFHPTSSIFVSYFSVEKSVRNIKSNNNNITSPVLQISMVCKISNQKSGLPLQILMTQDDRGGIVRIYSSGVKMTSKV